MEQIKILIVDDHEVVRLGLASLFEQYPYFSVVGEASNAADALHKVEECQPEVVILDIRLQKGNGIEVCREVTSKYQGVNVIILTSYGEEDLVLEAIMAGAKGYILKDVGNDELIRAIEAVRKGESLLDPVITKKLLERMRRPVHERSEIELLSKQEKKVLGLVASGKTNREIAHTIYLSEKTVRNYVSKILTKLNLTNRTEAAAFAAKMDLAEATAHRHNGS
ncbi:MAG: response regulator transcription factor [Bacillota bacterium]